MKGWSIMSKSLLIELGRALANEEVRVVDLTHTLSEDFPVLQLPAQFGQVKPFRLERISHYDESGPAWYWNNFTCGEHSGTHFDAPAHWISGREHANNTVDRIPEANFVAPAVVVDATDPVSRDSDWILSVEYLREWESTHGMIPAGAWVLFRTDWSKKISDTDQFLGMKEDGAHTPGPSQAAVEYLVKERDVLGFGVETINTDAGLSFSWPLPYPCHTLMHGANKYGLQCLRNLDLLPATGALVIASPLKIKGGSGSPLRVIALVESS
jgi:kynurenine formamidase